jgi:hypothetical protein
MITLQPDAHAFVTHSRRMRKPGLLARMTGSGDRDAEHLTAIVIGPRDLLVGTHGAGAAPGRTPAAKPARAPAALHRRSGRASACG